MTPRILPILAAIVAAGAVAACADAQDRQPGEMGANKTTAGTVLGAIGGGLLGAQVGGGKGQLVAVGAGTLLGAFLGREIGASLDRADIEHARRAQERAHAAPIGERITWSNPDSGHSGTITPRREGTDSAGNQCREYRSTVAIAGKTEQAYGTACRQPDGTWKIVN